MQLKEGLAEASREGGSGLGDAALGTGELGGEAAQEVVLGLLLGQYRYGRQYAEGVGRQEDNALGGGAVRDGLDDVGDEVDGVRDAGVLGNALVGEVNLAVVVYGNVLE